MRLSPFACSACGGRYWPDPDSSCELCQPSDYDAEDRRRYAEPDWGEPHDWELEEETQAENETE